MNEKRKSVIPRRLDLRVLCAFIFVALFIFCHIGFRFSWSLVNGADNTQLIHSAVISKDLILDTVLFIMFLCSCMFIVTSELSFAETCKVVLAVTIGCAVTSGCLCVVYPISPEGRRSRNLFFNFLNLPLIIFSQNDHAQGRGATMLKLKTKSGKSRVAWSKLFELFLVLSLLPSAERRQEQFDWTFL